MPSEIIFKNDHCEWIDIASANKKDLDFLHQKFNINEFLLEDTIDPNHLPKYEEDEDLKFFLMRENTELKRQNLNSISDITTKLAIFLVDDKIITIHRLKNNSVKEVLREIKLWNEDVTSEHIALELALKVLKSFDDEARRILRVIDEMENEIFLSTDSPNLLRKLYNLKRKSSLNTMVLQLSSSWVARFRPLELTDSETTDLRDKLRDVISDFDHLNSQILNLISMFLALADQKANQTMKILTQFSAYFLPITFVAGLYGMNFQYMPELHSKYGYFITIGVMVLIVLCTFLYFKKKKW